MSKLHGSQSGRGKYLHSRWTRCSHRSIVGAGLVGGQHQGVKHKAPSVSLLSDSDIALLSINHIKRNRARSTVKSRSDDMSGEITRGLRRNSTPSGACPRQ